MRNDERERRDGHSEETYPCEPRSTGKILRRQLKEHERARRIGEQV